MHVIYKNGNRVTETGGLSEATAMCEKLLAELPAGELATFTVQSEDGLLLAAISNRRIVGTFYKQRWGGRKNDNAITEGQEEFDATNAVLLLDHDELVELEDNADTTDPLGTEHVDWAGPHYVNIVDSILEYFGVPDLEDITPEALEFVRARVRPQKATVKTLTLSIKVDVRVAPGADVSKLIENLDYTVTSKAPGIVVQNMEIEDASLYVIYSPNESAIQSGAGFWNNELGWVGLDAATKFVQAETKALTLPVATGLDARWILHTEAKQYYGT